MTENLPHMDPESLSILSKYLSKEKNMFEWGSGYSTTHFSNKCKNLISVEHDIYWYKKVINEISKKEIKNVIPILSKPSSSDYGFYKNTSPRSIAHYEWYHYIRAPEHIKELYPNFTFDVVFIDGRARVECAQSIFNHLHEDSVVLIHDFWKEGRLNAYRRVFDWYDEIESFKSGNTILVLKRKDCVKEEIRSGKDKFQALQSDIYNMLESYCHMSEFLSKDHPYINQDNYHGFLPKDQLEKLIQDGKPKIKK